MKEASAKVVDGPWPLDTPSKGCLGPLSEGHFQPEGLVAFAQVAVLGAIAAGLHQRLFAASGPGVTQRTPLWKAPTMGVPRFIPEQNHAQPLDGP